MCSAHRNSQKSYLEEEKERSSECQVDGDKDEQVAGLGHCCQKFAECS